MLKKIILWTAVVLLSCQIYSFSSANKAESSGMSKKITEVIVNIVEESVPTIGQSSMEREKLFETCHFLVRKTAHFSLYALLAVLTALLAQSYHFRMGIIALVSSAYCLLFAISDEIHQLFVDGRSGQISDVILDFCGALFGIGLFLLFCNVKRRFRKKHHSV